jgi:hypothetical protein
MATRPCVEQEDSRAWTGRLLERVTWFSRIDMDVYPMVR